MITHIIRLPREGNKTQDFNRDNVSKIQVTLDPVQFTDLDFNNILAGTFYRWVVLTIDGVEYILCQDNDFTVEFDPPLTKLNLVGFNVWQFVSGGAGLPYSPTDVTLSGTLGTIRFTVHHDLFL